MIGRFACRTRAKLDEIGLEPALFLAVGARVWQSAAGLVTLYFVIEYFSPRTQGYYQTFLSLIALQSFLELGMLIAIVSVISHEWAGLSLSHDGRVVGLPDKRNRLAAATRSVALWFLGAALLLFFVGGGVGLAVLMRHGNPHLWLTPWIVVIGLSSALLWCQGMIAVLEGCNQIFAVAAYRLIQSVAWLLTLWTAMAGGAGLWSLAAQLGIGLICAVLLIGFFYRRLFTDLLQTRKPSSFSWRIDIWPMQWPLAIQGVGVYFNFALFVPVIFAYHGPIEAGRMGLSLQVVIALVAIASAWLQVKTPRLGTLFAMGDYRGYESVWTKTFAVCTFVAAAGALSASLLVWLGWTSEIPQANRFLNPVAFTLLLVWGVMLSVLQCMAAYWRAQRREPIGFWGVLPGVATGFGVWLLGKNYGAVGAAAAAFGAMALVSIPLFLYFLRQSRLLTAHRRKQAVP